MLAGLPAAEQEPSEAAAGEGVVPPVAGSDMAAAVDVVNVVDPADVEGLVNGPGSVDPDATIPG